MEQKSSTIENKIFTSENELNKSILKIKQVPISNNGELKSFQEINIPNETKTKKNNKEKKREEIKNLLMEIILTPSTRAITKIIFTPKLILKVVLLAFVIGLGGYASYLVIQSILSYFTFDVTTKSRSFYETPSLFPKITFCNINFYQTEYAYNLTLINYNDIALSLDEKKMLGHGLNDILIGCSFNINSCKSNDFIWSWDASYGNCYTFNSGFDSNGNKMDLKESTIAGPYYGLQLTFYVNIYEKLIGYSSSFGAVIRIGNSSYLTYYSFGDGILVSPGSVTNIGVDREFKSMLPKPYSSCEIDSSSPKYIRGLDLYNLIIESNYEYTQQLCFSQCYQKYIIKKYNCSSIWYPSVFDVTQCTLDFSNTLWYSNVDSFDITFINENCMSLCPLECEQILYKSSISFNQLNGYNFISSIKSNSNLSNDFINRTLDVATAEKSFVQLNIFYDSLSYTLTEESPQMDAVSLLGSIGGNLGLFLGVSFFSLSEIFEMIMEIIFFIHKRRKNTIESNLE